MNESLIGQTTTTTAEDTYELVGEGKKFKDFKALEKSKVESDLYIKHLEQRLDEMREDYLKVRDENVSRARLEELIDQLQTRQPTTSSKEPKAKEVTKPSFDPDELDTLVTKKIQQHETSIKQRDNFNSVMAKLKEQYGENYETVLKTRMEEMELDVPFVDDLARNRPKAFFKTLGLDQPELAPRKDPFATPLRTQQRSDSFAPKVEKRTWSYYQKMRKETPKLYTDPKTQVQMHNDALALGDEFNDGDWGAL